VMASVTNAMATDQCGSLDQSVNARSCAVGLPGVMTSTSRRREHDQRQHTRTRQVASGTRAAPTSGLGWITRSSRGRPCSCTAFRERISFHTAALLSGPRTWRSVLLLRLSASAVKRRVTCAPDREEKDNSRTRQRPVAVTVVRMRRAPLGLGADSPILGSGFCVRLRMSRSSKSWCVNGAAAYGASSGLPCTCPACSRSPPAAATASSINAHAPNVHRREGASRAYHDGSRAAAAQARAPGRATLRCFGTT